jgi:hypothetical protein
MQILKGINLTIRFLLELGLLVAVSFWGFRMQPTLGLKLLIGILGPVLIAVIWGIYAAPKSARKLTGIPYIILTLILLGLGAAALFASQNSTLGWIYSVLLIVSTILVVLWKQ